MSLFEDRWKPLSGDITIRVRQHRKTIGHIRRTPRRSARNTHWRIYYTGAFHRMRGNCDRGFYINVPTQAGSTRRKDKAHHE
jgi:hypothetical protein